MTKAEISFYGVLQQVTGGNYTIFSMVRLADVIQVEKGTQKRQGYFNKIKAKHLDFVCCDPATMEVVFAIELDDSSGTGIDQLAKIVDAADRAAVKALNKADGKAELATSRELFVTYLTAWATRKGDLNYREDIYGRDARVMKELGL